MASNSALAERRRVKADRRENDDTTVERAGGHLERSQQQTCGAAAYDQAVV